MINRENYEIYFIDYLDGKLNAQLAEELSAFLVQNPDLAEELAAMKEGMDIVITENLAFPDKSGLKKLSPITAGNDKDYFIGHLEGDLNPEEEKYLKLYLNENPHTLTLFESFQKTKVVADEKLVYEKKNKLKKKTKVIPFYWIGSSAVAAVLLGLLLFPYIMQKENETKDLSEVIINKEPEVKTTKEPTKALELPTPKQETRVTKEEIKPFKKNTVNPKTFLKPESTKPSQEQGKIYPMEKIALEETIKLVSIDRGFYKNSLKQAEKVSVEEEQNYSLKEFLVEKVLKDDKWIKRSKEVQENINENTFFTLVDKQTNGFLKIEKSNENELLGYELKLGNRVTISKK